MPYSTFPSREKWAHRLWFKVGLQPSFLESVHDTYGHSLVFDRLHPVVAEFLREWAVVFGPEDQPEKRV